MAVSGNDLCVTE